MKKQPRTELLGLRVTKDDAERLRFAAKVSGKKPTTIAYELIRKGLQG